MTIFTIGYFLMLVLKKYDYIMINRSCGDVIDIEIVRIGSFLITLQTEGAITSPFRINKSNNTFLIDVSNANGFTYPCEITFTAKFRP